MEHDCEGYINSNLCSCTVTEGLVKGLEDLEITGRVETIETTALLRSARILRRILKTWEVLLSLKLSGDASQGHSGPGTDCSNGVLDIRQNSALLETHRQIV